MSVFKNYEKNVELLKKVDLKDKEVCKQQIKDIEKIFFDISNDINILNDIRQNLVKYLYTVGDTLKELKKEDTVDNIQESNDEFDEKFKDEENNEDELKLKKKKKSRKKRTKKAKKND